MFVQAVIRKLYTRMHPHMHTAVRHENYLSIYVQKIFNTFYV